MPTTQLKDSKLRGVLSKFNRRRSPLTSRSGRRCSPYIANCDENRKEAAPWVTAPEQVRAEQELGGISTVTGRTG